MLICPFCEQNLKQLHNVVGKDEIYPCGSCHNPLRITTVNGSQTVTAVPGWHDIRRDSPEQSVGAIILSLLDNPDYTLPLIPEIRDCLKENMTQDLKKLMKIVSSDPVVSIRVLAAANSDIFGGLRRAQDIHEAVERLGLSRLKKELKKIITGPVFKLENPVIHEAVYSCWKNSVFTAHCAKETAKAADLEHPDSLYLAGLLHDIGKFMVFDILEHRNDEAIKAVMDSENIFTETLKYFHPLLGLNIATAYRCPDFVASIAFLHHEKELEPDADITSLVYAVQLSNTVAHATGYGGKPENPVSLLIHPANRHLHLSDVRIASIRVELSDKLTDLFEELELTPVPVDF